MFNLKFNFNVVPWWVAEHWTKPYKPEISNKPGSDCISGAKFTALVAQMVGIPGTIEAKAIASTPAKPKVAEEYSLLTQGNRLVDSKYEVTTYFTRGDNPEANSFEAIVSYKTAAAQNPKTFYFPSGAGPLAFDKLDDVLTVFGSYEWAKAGANGAEQIGGEKNILATWEKTAKSVKFD